jgi:hypothetical protein
MKYILVLSLLMAACDIEGAIGNASQRCEDEIAKIIQSIESTCLTKDELMDIIDSVRVQNDQRSDCVGSD